ncbi:D-glycerate dehydrogenase [Patescibacteria group bacterium]|nr:D-glycerate dehydrogenase [Patescibacteria group bacterium]
MLKPKVIIARKIPKDGLDELYKHCKVKMHASQDPPTKKQLISYAKSADALMTTVTEEVDKDVLRANPDLKIVANYALGFNNIDLKSAKARNVYASNTPSMMSASAVAQHAFALLFALARRLPQSDAFVKAGKYKAWSPVLFLGDDMREKTLGIVGGGRIGCSLAEFAKTCFDMKILYSDVVRSPQIEKKCKAKKVSLDSLLKESDYVSLHVPLLPSTKHLIGLKELSQMKESAILINTSRGGVIDEKALVRTLRAKKIAGAGLDVFENEPKLSLGLAKLSNIILTPHTASATIEAREEMGRQATENILDVLIHGKAPRNEVKA